MTTGIQLIASGDSRLAPNQVGWPAQQSLEAALTEAVSALGGQLVRAHAVDTEKRRRETVEQVPPAEPAATEE